MENTTVRIGFKDGVKLAESQAGWLLCCGRLRLSLAFASLGTRAVAEALLRGDATESELAQLMQKCDGETDLPRLLCDLQRYTQCGLLSYAVYAGDEKLATLVYTAPHPMEYALRFPEEGQCYTLSRFAYMRAVVPRNSNEGNCLILESPLGHAKLMIHDWRAASVIAVLAVGRTPQRVHEQFSALPALSVRALMALLMRCNSLHAVAVNQNYTQEAPSLAQWSFHDLLFHTRTRSGRTDAIWGKVYPFRGRTLALPAIKPPMAAAKDAIDLYIPDIEALKKRDMPFTCVLERRVSIRAHGEPPLTVRQLGEFLYRAARVKSRHDATASPLRAYEYTHRPGPGGGAAHEIEIYPLIRNCAGIAPGLYHYHPLYHRLYKLRAPGLDLYELLDEAHYATARNGQPQILFVLTARFRRLSWCYESIVYATILKDVGVLLQTMYLVATAMGLAPCAIGYGNADLFARIAHLDYFAESSVGEFMLGSIGDDRNNA